MNPIRLFGHVLKASEAKPSPNQLPTIKELVAQYVLPLAIIPPLMLYFVIHDRPKLFMDILPGNRLVIVGVELFLLQVFVVMILSWVTQNLASMVSLAPSFKEAMLVITVAAIPLWLFSFFFLIPNLTINFLAHAVGVMLSAYLVYSGVKNVFGLKQRGAIAMLTIAIIGTAGLAFAVILSGTLISWSEIQKFQLSIKG